MLSAFFKINSTTAFFFNLLLINSFLNPEKILLLWFEYVDFGLTEVAKILMVGFLK